MPSTRYSLRDADLQALDRPCRAPPRSPAPGRSAEVVSFGSTLAIELQHDRGVAHVAGDRAGLVERGGEGDDAPARAAAVGRLDADRAGEGGRLADRAAGVGGGGAGAEMGGDRRGRAARRAAGHERGVGAAGAPRIDDGAVVGGLVGRAHGELVHVELAEHDRAVGPQIGGDGRFVDAA